ncbi:MAG TPA: GMC family oxidoreductase, partial [Longimicrobium sp.]
VDPRSEGQNVAHDLGQRCAGNNSCTPICPIQAKYNANKTLEKAVRTRNVKVLTHAVASRVLVDEGGAVKGIEVKCYRHPDSAEHTVHVARGTMYVLAAHAVENAKLMLASGLESSSGQMGRNLMDHPVMINWGLLPERAGAYRGPLSTSGIEDLRGGSFRARHAAFRVEIGNDGWVWPMGGPNTTVGDALKTGLFGARLREHLGHTVSRQFRLGFLIEQMPMAANRVTIDRAYTDRLGNFRPVIDYDLEPYTLEGMRVAREISDLVFSHAGAANMTQTKDNFIGAATWNGVTYPWDGAGHFAGTHVMGTGRGDSVVDADQRSWDHRNLYLVGCGSMPTMGTSNPTLTITAMAFRTARALLRDLGGSAPQAAAPSHAATEASR